MWVHGSLDRRGTLGTNRCDSIFFSTFVATWLMLFLFTEVYLKRESGAIPELYPQL